MLRARTLTSGMLWALALVGVALAVRLLPCLPAALTAVQAFVIYKVAQPILVVRSQQPALSYKFAFDTKAVRCRSLTRDAHHAPRLGDASAAAIDVCEGCSNDAFAWQGRQEFPSLFDEPSVHLSVIVPAYNEGACSRGR
jgi:hypothetical protein